MGGGVGEEGEDMIDDVFLNNMERQWTGKDFLMEHIEHVALHVQHCQAQMMQAHGNFEGGGGGGGGGHDPTHE